MNLSSSGGSGSSSSSNNNPPIPTRRVKYVYELPYTERKELTRILDENNQWEVLGGNFMGFDCGELGEFSRSVLRGGSASDSLLTSWGNQNHTILELFVLLAKLKQYRAMNTIAKFVEAKYHVHIKDHEFTATAELIQLEAAELKNPSCQVSPPEIKHEPVEKLPESKGKNANIKESCGLLPQIPYDELLHATDNWDRRNILGKGGFGTVFQGIWKNTSVAIKRMERRGNEAYIESQLKQSLGELRYLNAYRHDNILPLYGFSLEGQHPCLVYQFMKNGSLEDRLLCRQKTLPLGWNLRYSIARGVALGIQFLHSIGDKPLIHGDIKSANILLDRNFEAKLGDFGLAREMSSAGEYVKVSRVHGTRPYLPDEYLRSKKLSTKVDTFSFGIMLYEMAAGQRAYEESRAKKFLKEMFEEAEENAGYLKDPRMGESSSEIFHALAKLGKVCTSKLSRNRPEMVTVLKTLDDLISQVSIRTISSGVTGLPFLFDSKHLVPTGISTNRLSPEMRPGSPARRSPISIPEVEQIPAVISENSSPTAIPLITELGIKD